MPNRRDFLQSTAALGAGLITATTATAESSRALTSTTQNALSGGYRGVSSGSLSKADTHNGFEDHIGYDGMPGISQEPVRPGGTFVYNFTIKQEGTYFYPSHMAMQEMAGMLGAFIMHPKEPYRPHCDKDFALHLQQYSVLANSTTPDTMSMNWNWLLLNGESWPGSHAAYRSAGRSCSRSLCQSGYATSPHAHPWAHLLCHRN